MRAILSKIMILIPTIQKGSVKIGIEKSGSSGF